MKEAPEEIQDHVYKTFLEDCHVRYFVTSAKNGKKKLDEDGLKIRGRVNGNHSRCKSTITLRL